jgi:hypothetical protein
MKVILSDISTKHGTVRNFVREIGVGEETIDSLMRTLLAPQ